VEQTRSLTVPHWHILGAGAIGSLFASALQRAGLPVTLLLREACERVQLALEEDGTVERLSFAASRPEDPGPVTHLLVTTKAYDVRAAVLSVAHRLDANSQVLLLANGLGFADELHRDLRQLDCYLGSTTEGAYRVSQRRICHAGRGFTRVGRPGNTTPPQWFRYWSDAVQPGTWDNDIERTLWLKLAINCAINPLTALFRCCNGKLAQADLDRQVRALCEEIAPVSAAAGYPISYDELYRQVREVIAATAANRSSMLQDVVAGRPTEIDYITGYLVQQARLYGIAVPLNEGLMTKVAELAN